MSDTRKNYFNPWYVMHKNMNIFVKNIFRKNKCPHNIYIYNHKYFSAFQKVYQCEINLQTKIQIAQQQSKQKLKNHTHAKKVGRTSQILFGIY